MKNYQRDIDDIQSINVIPKILNVISESTGLGFVAVARVTTDKWLTCGVLDNLNFGLLPGDELKVESTICHEVRQAKQLVVIDDVGTDAYYRDHHTPKIYGFKSYISVPIFRNNGNFFGTLCALDPKPNKLDNSKVVGMFTLYAELISFHLDAIETLREKNKEITTKNHQLATYDFVSSHDLQEPLRKIQMFCSLIREKETQKLTEPVKGYFNKIESAAKRMRHILKDLLEYSEVKELSDRYKFTNLSKVILRTKDRLATEITTSKATLLTEDLYSLKIIPSQIEQLFYCLLMNSITFRSLDRKLVIKIANTIGKGQDLDLKIQNHKLLIVKLSFKITERVSMQYITRKFLVCFSN
ncbi:GAF domain-containing sensor histidine kinase [Cellulophaga baltica]|uniref:GAF domain-containing sensor histidine kinase n=1 Tax=Cellulophaga baltica TaxID=76594 RepID=UPI0015F5C9AC|nr:GAF domain-containing protein [Cellulophaga baltica]MBA6314503.1 GAF domain-containing protein [Cellulophaga baltica]